MVGSTESLIFQDIPDTLGTHLQELSQELRGTHF